MRIEIEKALVFISQHFRNKITTDQLADAGGVSSFHFHRLFLKETGLTPQKYVEKLRLEHAEHMMALNPEISMIQLAFESGFSSPSAFSRAFHNYFGQSPTQLKKKTPNPTLDAEKLEKSQLFSITHDLQIQYLSSLSLSAQLITPESHRIEEVVSDHYQHLAPTTLYGVYLDAPIHLPPQNCRYLIGKSSDSQDSNYQIEAGYFVKTIEKGSFEVLKHRVIELHKYLTQHKYRIREPLAFEKINISSKDISFNYLEIERELFIPISRI